ncbi:hypothetical protein VC279_05975 [Xanthomonas sp. WHRI 10064A]|uniref:hypothetical protein n=1 Tax=unclassified Xanthomonas TaxID=2643310 RepID=UPI002B23B4B1|nr:MULTISPECIES: hypothetical protein [unclassified Xanthomonas]MEA9585859.1 hypothetical protein [Xanthomonas sp. WHRI 10064B]MEA9614286.1 hypothetical protein [Xanthomonas sp. WHRI 10064A]
MTSDRSSGSSTWPGFNYARFQLAKALDTTEHHTDSQARLRAGVRAERWMQVLEHVLMETAHYGSRTPFADVPAWATLEVNTGGFATGRLLAGGELTAYERELSKRGVHVSADQVRLDLNLWHLTEAGLGHLQRMLTEGGYSIDLPEEAALPMVAWLVGQGRIEQAQTIIEAIAPFFDRLRFFPARIDGTSPLSAEVSIFTAGDVRQRLSELGAQRRLAAQKWSIEIRLPLYDATISLFLDTYVDGWPCRRFPGDWQASAKALVAGISDAPADGHGDLTRQRDRVTEAFALLAACADDPAALTGRQVGRIRRIVDDFVEAHGRPDSSRHLAFRQQQQRDVASAAHHRIGHAVAARLAAYPPSEGIADFSALSAPINEDEAATFGIEPDQQLPDPVRYRLERCRRGTIAELVDAGIVTSGDTIARVLPVLIAEIRSSELANPTLRCLYAATYRAFRRRRSLLLLNLEGQVRLNELPWISVVDGDRNADTVTAGAARAALIESASMTISAFPHAITPNKLVREFRVLADGAKLKLPFVDEIATDIFTGEFTNTFIEAARFAAQVIAGTLYADYYNIDTDALAVLPDRLKAEIKRNGWSRANDSTDALSTLATRRANASSGGWSPAINGTILEQVQILTTHNLAVLFDGAGLRAMLHPTLDAIALQSFQWICRRQQMQIPHWHAQLIMLKNTAYAWRQMLFFLSMLDDARRQVAIARIEAHFYEQPNTLRSRFEPVMWGLRLAAEGRRLPQHETGPNGARVFKGWTTERHWLAS